MATISQSSLTKRIVVSHVKFCVECGSPLKDRIKNPHNPKDELCSQGCAKAARLRYLETGPKNYVLNAEGAQGILGVYNSLETLAIGVAYWQANYTRTKRKLGKLFYELWIDNYPQGAKEWDFVKTKKK